MTSATIVRATKYTRELAMLFLLVCVVAGCIDPSERPLEYPTSRAPKPSFSIVADSGCATLGFTILDTVTASVTFPNRPCGGGLMLINAGAATWDNSTKKLSIPIRVLNVSDAAAIGPVRMVLSDTGRYVVTPSGQPRNKLSAANADTLYAAEQEAVWYIPRTDTIIPAGDSSNARTIELTVDSPVTAGSISTLLWTPAQIVGVPSAPPNHIPGWVLSDSAMTSGSPSVTRRILTVTFTEAATVPQKSAAIDSVGGSVIGGVRMTVNPSQGTYIIYVPSGVSFDSLKAARVILERQPGVKFVTYSFRIKTEGRRPTDGSGWSRFDWTYNPDTSSGKKWAFEDVALPLAWGCEIGSASTRIGVLDDYFRPSEYSAQNVIGGVPTALGAPNTPSHGTRVASVIAAKANDSVGGAGVNWRAGLLLQRVVSSHSAGLKLSAAQAAFDTLLRRNPSIVNISLGVDLADSALAGDAFTIAANVLEYHSPNLPLIVVAAGNNRSDARLSGWPAIADSFPNHVIVVGGSSLRSGATRSRWGGPSTTPAPDAGSNHGSLVDVYAPGQAIWIWNADAAAFDSVDGTSYAAPIVSGIAGLLKSFDPTLTPSELKALILQGAQNGGRQISGHSGKYLVNAHESLKLAARRNETPICGFPVRVAGDSVVLMRPNGDEKFAHDVPLAWGSTIAQGGRLVAVHGYDSTWTTLVQEYQYSSSTRTWVTSGSLRTGIQTRHYTEWDTVDQISVNQSVIRHAAGGAPTTINHRTLAGAGGTPPWGSDAYLWAVSPDGQYGVIEMDFYAQDLPCSTNADSNIVVIVKFPSGPVQSVSRTRGSTCSGYWEQRYTASAWNVTGDRVVFAFNRFLYPDSMEVLFVEDSISTSGTHSFNSTTVPGRWAGFIPFLGLGIYGSTIKLLEVVGFGWPGTCEISERSARPPFTFLSSTSWDCEDYMLVFPQIYNAPTANEGSPPFLRPQRGLKRQQPRYSMQAN